VKYRNPLGRAKLDQSSHKNSLRPATYQCPSSCHLGQTMYKRTVTKKNSKQHISTQHAATTSIIYKHCSHQQHTCRTDHVTLQMVVEFVCKPNSATRRRVRDMLTADIHLAVAAGERASSSLYPRHRPQPHRAESPGDDVSLASVSRDPAAGFQLRHTRTLTDTLLPSNKTVRPR